MRFLQLSFFILAFLLNSCDNNRFLPTEKAVARVYGNYLYASELAGIVPLDATPADSQAIVNSYINNWIKNQLLLQQAEKNLPNEKKDFSVQLRDYRNSLIIYTYESELIRQNLDTTVSDFELETYYQTNINNFILKEDILQFFYIKMRAESSLVPVIRKFLKKNFEHHQDSLTRIALNYSEDYALITEEWIPLTRFVSKVPLQIDDSKSFLEQNKFKEIEEDPFIHFIYFTAFRLKGTTAPLSFVKDNIRLIILNKRKKELIREMHQEIYDQAGKNNDIEYF
ncbi:MAG TPA: hypothetical protein PK915_00535 [Bacteroidales bacterium]|nr:hypothetical protein [Bacteroidales bacterium]